MGRLDYFKRKAGLLEKLLNDQAIEQKIDKGDLKVYQLMKILCMAALDKIEQLESELSEYKRKTK